MWQSRTTTSGVSFRTRAVTPKGESAQNRAHAPLSKESRRGGQDERVVIDQEDRDRVCVVGWHHESVYGPRAWTFSAPATRPKRLKTRLARPFHSSMETCRDCGVALRHSQTHMRVFSTLIEASPVRVEADECPHCGRLFPADGAVESALARRDAVTVPPPSWGRLKHAG